MVRDVKFLVYGNGNILYGDEGAYYDRDPLRKIKVKTDASFQKLLHIICTGIRINPSTQLEVFHRHPIFTSTRGVRAHYSLVPIIDNNDLENLMEMAESMGENCMQELFIKVHDGFGAPPEHETPQNSPAWSFKLPGLIHGQLQYLDVPCAQPPASLQLHFCFIDILLQHTPGEPFCFYFDGFLVEQAGFYCRFLLEERLKKEQEEKECKEKEKAETHLCTIIKVTRDKDLAEQIGKDIFFDLVDHNKVRSFCMRKQMPFKLFKMDGTEDMEEASWCVANAPWSCAVFCKMILGIGRVGMILFYLVKLVYGMK